MARTHGRCRRSLLFTGEVLDLDGCQTNGMLKNRAKNRSHRNRGLSGEWPFLRKSNGSRHHLFRCDGAYDPRVMHCGVTVLVGRTHFFALEASFWLSTPGDVVHHSNHGNTRRCIFGPKWTSPQSRRVEALARMTNGHRDPRGKLQENGTLNTTTFRTQRSPPYSRKKYFRGGCSAVLCHPSPAPRPP